MNCMEYFHYEFGCVIKVQETNEIYQIILLFVYTFCVHLVI